VVGVSCLVSQGVSKVSNVSKWGHCAGCSAGTVSTVPAGSAGALYQRVVLVLYQRVVKKLFVFRFRICLV
jgi:hypothetical protein